ncbi:hypothetical protein NDU88_004730 [Pleurodeles waltl]|uniref:Uncharacterized protein n=1 Tax=Pleurodeles waltl TaxID=8319 RepID=A0AAV7LKT4_PLEWA|nr:hypothetical protein NDU88_004730 [Pleurodeles waltl]
MGGKGEARVTPERIMGFGPVLLPTLGLLAEPGPGTRPVWAETPSDTDRGALGPTRTLTGLREKNGEEGPEK